MADSCLHSWGAALTLKSFQTIAYLIKYVKYMIKPEFKRTKILATIGPSTNSYEKIEQLLKAGVNGCRLNFSHGDFEERRQQIAWIRKASEKLGKPVAILQDLQGPKIRLGIFNDDQPFSVKAGDELILDSEGEFNGKDVIPVQYNLADKTKVGEAIYIFDGKVKSEVVEIVSDTAVRINIQNDGIIRQKKGLNLPDTDMAGDILTEKDLKDIEFGATQDLDYVALSFVQSAEDIHNLRQLLLSHNSDAQIVAKIETKHAISEENLEEIVLASDAIMVARGDLAVEVGAEVVPVIQQDLVDLCRKHGKLVIIATQMMISMVENPEPTRSEVSDVAHAVMQGADAVMLSDESANGKYPIETVMAMKKVILYSQTHSRVRCPALEINEATQQIDVIASSAVEIAEVLDVPAIVVGTRTGLTATRVSAHRPNRVILSVTENRRVAQQLALSFANQSYIRPDTPNMCLDLVKELKNLGRFGEVDKIKVVATSGSQIVGQGATDTISVRDI